MLSKVARITSSCTTHFFVFSFGVSSLFLPHFSGWSEIVFPAIAHVGLLLYLVWPLFLHSALAFLGLSLVVALARKWHKKNKIIPLVLLVTLLLVWQLVYPFWISESDSAVSSDVDKRINSFPLGGQTRVFWAGGADKVRSDALLLLEVVPDEKGVIPSDEWPKTLKQLGAIAVETDKQTQTVIVYIPRANFFDPDTFGYLICDDKTPDPEVLRASRFVRPSGYRTWKLDEGLVFFEAW